MSYRDNVHQMNIENEKLDLPTLSNKITDTLDNIKEFQENNMTDELNNVAKDFFGDSPPHDLSFEPSMSMGE